MELNDFLNRLSAQLEQLLPRVETEEATKNALIMPLLNALGFNVFDPTEVVPEYTADVGTKKGEKVDYAIFLDSKPVILIECKAAGAKLSVNNASQLYRYFSVTEARFAVLTDGLRYRFFTDLDSPNRMDEKPFFEFNLEDYDDRAVAELKKFSKPQFDLENILSNASELKYAQQIKRLISQEFDSPSDEFVRHFTTQVYSGRITSSVQDQFRILVKKALFEFLRDRVNQRLRSAMDGVSLSASSPAEIETSNGAAVSSEAGGDNQEDDGIDTTVEEIEGYHIVRAILAKSVDPERIVMRDTKSYCGILLDDNNRKPICRLRFNHSQKYIGIFDAEKSETRKPIDRLTDIFAVAEDLESTVRRYDELKGTASEA